MYIFFTANTNQNKFINFLTTFQCKFVKVLVSDIILLELGPTHYKCDIFTKFIMVSHHLFAGINLSGTNCNINANLCITKIKKQYTALRQAFICPPF